MIWNNKNNNKNKRLDCHENTPYFLAMTTGKTKANCKDGNGIFLWIPAQLLRGNDKKLCIINAVTANPLGCGSLWKNKKQQTTTTGLPQKHFVFFRNDEKGKTDLFFMDCHGNKLPRNDDNGERQRQKTNNNGRNDETTNYKRQ